MISNYFMKYSCPVITIMTCLLFSCGEQSAQKANLDDTMLQDSLEIEETLTARGELLTLDTFRYYAKVKHLTHDSIDSAWVLKTPLPLPGAILPFHRIIAYYGNFYSKGMGVLGETAPKQMLARFRKEIANWEQADTTVKVMPAIHYIAVTAQKDPGSGNTYRLRMPESQIQIALALADSIDGLVFLDIQPGHASLTNEVEQLAKYLAMPNVHLGIDPEYSMKNGGVPGQRIGTMDAEDINNVADILERLVKEHNLPPKVLVVHRFTKGMVTNYKKIKTRPEVQIVIQMDGFGFPAKKLDSYRITIVNEPVQFAGFKLFYREDIKEGTRKTIMTPEEVLAIYPKPVYIQYQ